MSSKQIIICLFLVSAVRICTLSVKPSGDELRPSYPADALRFLHDTNKKEKRLSRYDFIVKKYAAAINMDWRLLSAIIWQESQYNSLAHSPMSAKGLMQIRDVTAVQYGIPDADLFDAETNIFLGTKLLGDLLKQFRDEGMGEDEALRFSLASYNSGGGTLASRREEAVSRGLDSGKWEDVSSIYMEHSTTTPAYVKAVEETYERYCRRMR